MKQTSLLYSLYFSFTFYFRVWLGSSPWVALEFSSLVCILIALSTKAPLTSRPLLQLKCLLPFSGTTIIATLFLALPVFLPHSHFYAAVRVIFLKNKVDNMIIIQTEETFGMQGSSPTVYRLQLEPHLTHSKISSHFPSLCILPIIFE